MIIITIERAIDEYRLYSSENGVLTMPGQGSESITAELSEKGSLLMLRGDWCGHVLYEYSNGGLSRPVIRLPAMSPLWSSFGKNHVSGYGAA
jgi:hypothetical protein